MCLIILWIVNTLQRTEHYITCYYRIKLCFVCFLLAPPSLGKGGVVGIVMVVFLLLLVAVDAMCCYKNNCGLLNFLNQKLFGHKISKMQDVEDGVINNAVYVTCALFLSIYQIQT